MTALYTKFLCTMPPDNLASHVVVCGLPDSITDFLQPLRSHGGRHTDVPVVIIALRKPTMRNFSGVMNAPNLCVPVPVPLVVAVRFVVGGRGGRGGRGGTSRWLVLPPWCVRSDVGAAAAAAGSSCLAPLVIQPR